LRVGKFAIDISILGYYIEPSFIYRKKVDMRLKEGNKEKDILDASIRVFAEYGYHQSKISKIAEVAGVATGSVYLYYKNKETILHKIFENLWKDLEKGMRVIAERSDLNPIEKLDGMIDLFFDKLINTPKLAIVFVNEMQFILEGGSSSFMKSYDKFLGLAGQVFTEGMKDGSINPNVDIDITRHFLLGGLRTLIREWAHDQEALPLNTIRNSVKYLIKYGVSSRVK